MSPRFRQRRSVLLNGPGSGRGGKRGGLVTPCLVGLCAVLAVAAGCLLVTLLLLQHQFRSPGSPKVLGPAEQERLVDAELRQSVEGHELWAMGRVREGLNVSGASLEDMVAWLLKHGERLRAARIILEDHRRRAGAVGAAGSANTVTPAPSWSTNYTTTTAESTSSTTVTTTTSTVENTTSALLPERPADAEPLEDTETIPASDVDGRQRELEAQRAEAQVLSSSPAASPAPAPAKAEPWRISPRLARDVLPEHYDLLMHPDLKKGTFSGRVDIRIRVLAPRRDVWLHAARMHVNEVELVLESAEGGGDAGDAAPQDGSGSTPWCALAPGVLKVEDAWLWPRHQFLVVRVDCLLVPGLYALRVSFSGSLLAPPEREPAPEPVPESWERGAASGAAAAEAAATARPGGIFRTSYRTATNETRYIATTKFEPTYARLAFPCFDEPAMKASYKVRLVKPASPEYIALSNSDVMANTTDPGTNLTTVEFAETVKMSSYLAAFIVCDFVKSETVSERGVPVNVIARKEQIDNTKEAQYVAKNVVDFYTEYFNISYPMPKIDLIAIPDFVSGAMENWGLITFRETSFLFDPKENSPANQESISETVAHELAHMWFGNLVTMKWWTDLWLNEGFATFMAQKSVAALHKDWDYGDQFVVDTLLSVLKLDAELSSHPVLQEVSSPDQITEIFDTISYDKGSSVILMLEAFMGEEPFKKGLESYLRTHQYNNAETANLWSALQDFAPKGVDVTKVMDTWTRQMGFPLVTVNRNQAGELVLSQKRFLSNHDAKYDPSTSKFGYKWEIPVKYSTSSSKDNELIWLTSDKETVSIPVDASVQWIKLNHNQRAYYRVMYDEQGWAALISALNQKLEQIDAVDRAGLISDAFSLADAEELKYETALELTQYLKNEVSFVPWDAGSTAISTLLQRLPTSEDLMKYGRTLVLPIAAKLGWSVGESDEHLDRRLRALVLDLACSLKDKDALKQANSLFALWLDGGQKPHPDVRSVVYKYGLGDSQDEGLWNKLFDKFNSETNTQEKIKLMYALSTTPNETLLSRYIEIAKDESIIRSQDYFTVLAYIVQNPKGVQKVWDFYRDEYDYLVKRFTLNDRIFGRFIARIASNFYTEERKKEVTDFFEKYPDAGAGAAARKQALEGIDNRIKWLKTHKDSVENWLKTHSS